MFGDEAPFHDAVINRFNKFISGRQPLKDEVREGPLKTAVLPECIDAVHELQHRHMTYREIKAYAIA